MTDTLFQISGGMIAILVLARAASALYTAARRHRTSLAILQRRLADAAEHARVNRILNERRLEQTELSWIGYRKFSIDKKMFEDPDRTICTFHLVPHDGRPVPEFKPGQFLTFQLRINGHGDRADKPTVRCYSLSDSPNPDYYRVTIKKLRPPPDQSDVPGGIASTFFHEELEEGDILDVKAPSGKFFLDLNEDRPVVLIGGGVGVTPLLSMLNAIVAQGSRQETWFFYGVRNHGEHIQREHLEDIAQNHANVRLQVCYSHPTDGDAGDLTCQHQERISVDLLRRVLPSNNFAFYICGPPPMMTDLYGGLTDWGVPNEDIHFEAFGPATVKKTADATSAVPSGDLEGVKVTFAKSGKVGTWGDDVAFLLELAEKHGVPIDSGCRVGNCNSCLTAIKQGDVRYVREPDSMPEAGSCLTCISVPSGDLVLDA